MDTEVSMRGKAGSGTMSDKISPIPSAISGAAASFTVATRPSLLQRAESVFRELFPRLKGLRFDGAISVRMPAYEIEVCWQSDRQLIC